MNFAFPHFIYQPGSQSFAYLFFFWAMGHYQFKHDAARIPYQLRFMLNRLYVFSTCVIFGSIGLRFLPYASVFEYASVACGLVALSSSSLFFYRAVKCFVMKSLYPEDVSLSRLLMAHFRLSWPFLYMVSVMIIHPLGGISVLQWFSVLIASLYRFWDDSGETSLSLQADYNYFILNTRMVR